jgi:hypothetical protein
MAIKSDVSAFFDYEAFAVQGFYQSATASGVVPVIFDNAGKFIDENGIQFETTDPTAYVQATDVPAPSNTDTLIIPYPGGVTYHVTKADPSADNAIFTLSLTKVS